MTDLLHTLPDFPTKSYTHLIPSLEKHLITTTDLLTLDALEIAKRAQLPVLDVRRLATHILAALQGQLGLTASDDQIKSNPSEQGGKDKGHLRKTGRDLGDQWSMISSLDDEIDEALGGGIPTGYITEITGESGAGKTQLLLTLLLSAQLPPPHGLSRPTLYISTEHPLPTKRLSQVLATNPILSSQPSSSTTGPAPPSLTQILTLQTPDLESQDHILTYQLPVALSRHNIGLVVIDSIAANYRAETSSHTTHTSTPSKTRGASLAHRSAELVRLGQLLRNLAREYNVAIVVANQVADRFTPLPAPTTNLHPYHQHQQSRVQDPRLRQPYPSSSPTPGVLAQPSSSPASTSQALPLPQPLAAPSPYLTLTAYSTLLTLDHQQRWFTGWGDSPPPSFFPIENNQNQDQNLKTPSLGLVWSNQIACRIALIKEATYSSHSHPHFLDDRDDRDITSPQQEKEATRIQQHTDPAAMKININQQHTAEQHTADRAEWEPPLRWRRFLRVVYAPWVRGVGEGEKGVEVEVWGGGVRSVGR